jgi:cap1 methyltransferase
MSVYNEKRILEFGLIEKELILELWKQKSRLDNVFGNNQANIYYQVRDELHPEDRTGSSQFKNRAGDKLNEIDKSLKLLQVDENNACFVDVCGGPGAWSEFLLKKTKLNGYGITLIDNTKNFSWYQSLMHNNRWKMLTGVDLTGNIFNISNIKDFKEKITCKVSLVVADGGLTTPNRLEHLQELYSARLILSEIYLMSKILDITGNFCCKLFDTFSAFTVSLIYIMTLSFRECHIIKPHRSRRVNSERYIVGIGYMGVDPKYMALLEETYKNWNDDNVLTTFVDVNVMKSNTKFWNTITSYTKSICIQQTTCLKKIMDVVDVKLNN